MPFSLHTSSLKFFSALFLLTSSLPGLALAANGASSNNVDLPASSTANEGGIPGSSSFMFKPIDAAIFTLSIVFGLISALQLLSAAFNIPKHFSSSSLPFFSRKSVPFALPTPINTNPIPLYALGRIFPISLAMGAFCLLITYILRAAFWGGFFTGETPALDLGSVVSAWAVFAYLRDTFLTMSLLSFVCFRIRRLCYCTCRSKLHLVKRIFDSMLIFGVFMSGTAYMAYRAHLANALKGLNGDSGDFSAWDDVAVKQGDLMGLVQLRRANEGLLVAAAIVVFPSAVMLYVHARKYQSAPDREVAVVLGTIIAPMFLTHALYNLVMQEVLLTERNSQSPQGFPAGAICLVIYSNGLGFCNPSNVVGLELGRVIVTCVSLSVILWLLLRFSGASLADALKGRSSTNGSPQEYCGGQVYVHTHGLTYKV